MGIYPEASFSYDRRAGREDVLVRRFDNAYGLVVTTVYVPVAVFEERSTCYCCSCGERSGRDPYCRNHGFAGTRPCLQHGMQGQEDDEGKMPDSVQLERNRIDGIS